MRVELPESFEKRMQEMLGDEYESYIESYDNPRQYGLRINPMKITEEELAEGSGFSLDPIPWTKTGYFYKEEDQEERQRLSAQRFREKVYWWQMISVIPGPKHC